MFPRDGTSPTSFDSLFQCFITLIIKQKKNLPYVWSKFILFQFKTITSCPIATGPTRKLKSLEWIFSVALKDFKE